MLTNIKNCNKWTSECPAPRITLPLSTRQSSMLQSWKRHLAFTALLVYTNTSWFRFECHLSSILEDLWGSDALNIKNQPIQWHDCHSFSCVESRGAFATCETMVQVCSQVMTWETNNFLIVYSKMIGMHPVHISISANIWGNLHPCNNEHSSFNGCRERIFFVVFERDRSRVYHHARSG